jgi:DNA-binding transcriptional ArsR family regulator
MSKAEPAPAEVFAALGDPTRLSLVMTLSDGETRSIASLSLDAAMSRQALTKHLRVLERAGLVESVRAGRESRFVFRPDAVAAAKACLDRAARQWEDALGRLKSFAEHMPPPTR